MQRQNRIPMVLLLTASALVLAIVLALLRWFDFAETPLPGIKLSPSAGSAGWTFALEDGTALVPGPDGALDVPEGATLYCSVTLPTDITDAAPLAVTAYQCDIALLLDGALVVAPSGRFQAGAGFPAAAPASPAGFGRYDLLHAAGRTLTVAVQFFEGVPANLSALPSLTLYSESLLYDSSSLAAAASAARPAGMCLAAGLFLLGLFLFQLWQGRLDWGPLFLAVAALASALDQSISYTTYTLVNLRWLLTRLSTVGLLWLLWYRTTGPRRRWGRILAAFLTLVLIASSPFVASAPSAIRDALQGRLLPLALLAFLLAGGWEALHGHSWFRRFFCLSGILLAAGGIWCAVSYAITGVLYAPLDTALAVLFGMGYFSTFFSLIEPFLLVAAFLVVIHDFIRETARRDAEFQTLAARTALAGEQLAIMEERDRALRSQAHDTRHHWAVLLGLLRERQPDRAEEYLESLSEREIGTPAVYTAHPAVNAILTTALSSAQDLHIETEIRVELPERLSIPDTDLCVLLMNLLDNALDANKKAPEGAKRWMRFTMHIRGQYLYVGVENARFTAVERSEEGGLFRSTKEGGSHGYGLKSAQAVAWKYHSELRLEAAEGSFSASTALLLPEAGSAP